MPTPRTETLHLGDLTIAVTWKNIKHVHLSVYPPTGAVRMSAPRRTSLETLRLFAVAKLGWIRQQQQKLQAQARETPREYLDRESHYVWGQRYLLKIEEQAAPPSVALAHSTLVLRVRPGTPAAKRAALLAAWYRDQLKAALPPLIAKWEPLLGVQVARFFVQHMKTLWGSCTPRARSLRFNTELAKKPPECLEYIVVHEMVHLLEPSHNARFVSLMNHYLPNWQHYRALLNRLPVRNEVWED